MRSRGSPGAGIALTALPTGRETTTPSHLFRVIFANHSPSRAVLADVAVSSTPMAIIAQHVPVPGWSVAEVLRWKVPLPEPAERQVAESARMFFVRDMDLTTATLEDARRLEVVVDGLPLHGGAELAVDTTLVSALHRDG